VMDPIDLCLAGAARQAQLVRDGVVSARELIDATLHRIESLDPRLNAYRIVFADRALEQANDIDSGMRDQACLPLLGVPVAIKDDTDVAGEITAWETAAVGPSAAGDAEVVARLRSAGAIVIGKTNVVLMAWPWTSSPTWGVTDGRGTNSQIPRPSVLAFALVRGGRAPEPVASRWISPPQKPW
jgi:amidase